ncbi:BlaI/MecI/CopY family transcriptional regulator [uncultured Jatrophihabitans sp.]|uniref:BlaI/MecI/CopY family transcriptional regulator n=1 Tax=uncultured Jatrophihabitans sp. TaxID=1610747 RepID=UPI0035CB7F77
MTATGRSRGALEREVLACLGASDRPMTVHEVLDELDAELAYTTVMTTLSRLHAKNAVAREAAGRAFRYSLPGGAAAAQASMTAHSMHRLLERGENRQTVLTKFVDELTTADGELLRQLLESERRSERGSESEPALESERGSAHGDEVPRS